jgi:hypothetical protein
MKRSLLVRAGVTALAFLALAPAAQAATKPSLAEPVALGGTVSDVAVDADGRRDLAG